MAELSSYGLTGGCEGSIIRPTLPIDFTAAHQSQTVIKLTWTEIDDPDKIQLEWSLTDGNYIPLIELNPGIEIYNHTGRTAATHYYYRFRCHKRVKWSDYVKSDDTTDT